MSTPKPTRRQLVARLAAHESWARTPDRTARTAPARDAFLAKFEDLVDPDHKLPPDERARRAVNARKAHFTRLALRSAQARRSAGAHRQAMEELREATAMLASAAEPPEPDPSEDSPQRAESPRADEHEQGSSASSEGAMR